MYQKISQVWGKQERIIIRMRDDYYILFTIIFLSSYKPFIRLTQR